MSRSSSQCDLLRAPQRRFAAIGYAMRALKLLPPSVLGKIFQNAVAGGAIPDVPDLVLMLEKSGPIPLFGPSDAELIAHDPSLADVEVTEPLITGRGVQVPARLYRRREIGRAHGGAALVWVHGGAFLGGDLTGPEAHWVGLALAAKGIPVLSLTYRMALNGSRFPDASDDVLAGWNWAVDHADELGVAPDRLHLGGASAGGNLTAGVAKRLRDGAGRPPASLLLAYPLLHAELPEWEPEELQALQNSEGPLFTAEWVKDLGMHYVGATDLFSDPYAFPANGGLAGLPPTLIFNCEFDTLRISGEVFARDLASAGVEVEVKTVTGAAHGSLAEPLKPAGPDSLALMTHWLSRHA